MNKMAKELLKGDMLILRGIEYLVNNIEIIEGKKWVKVFTDKRTLNLTDSNIIVIK